MGATRRAFVEYDSAFKKMSIIARDEETLTWLQEPGPAAIIREVCESVYGAMVAPDPHPTERPRPAGVVTPTILAATLLARFRAAFPDETFEINRGLRGHGATLDYGTLE